MSAPPVAYSSRWRAILDRAGWACECTGSCGVRARGHSAPHPLGQGPCESPHRYGTVPLTVGPRPECAGLSETARARLSDGDLWAMCQPCAAGHEVRTAGTRARLEQIEDWATAAGAGLVELELGPVRVVELATTTGRPPRPRRPMS